jgi:hypothetical protein
MPKTKGEEIKKHGDKLEPLIDRVGSGSSPGNRKESADADLAEPQDDDDEDLQSDVGEEDRDIDERE